jgi:glyoxylase-like metal-dependent hydrolase (beta-lactamase superfamily II)
VLATQIADQVYALSTDYPQVANCPLAVYLVCGTTAVLVDSGVASTYDAVLAPALKELKIGPRDVDLLLVTHGHPDHMGGAFAVKAATGASIGAPLDEVGWVESFDRQWREYWLELGAGYAIDSERAVLAGLAGPPVAVDRPLRDNDALEVGARTFTVIQTRGHTRGHCAYLDTQSGSLFTGDGVQGDGVPASHGKSVFAPMYADVDDYLAGLRRLEAVDFGLMCPAHLPPMPRRAALELLSRSIEFAEVTAPACVRAAIGRAGRGAVRLHDVAAEIGREVGTDPPVSPQSVMTALAHLRKLTRDEGWNVGLVFNEREFDSRVEG